VLTVGWYNKAMGEEQQQSIIKSISPESATTGETITLSIQLDESLGSPPIPPSDIMPELVKIGDIEATSIQRSNFVITAAFSIPGTPNVKELQSIVDYSRSPDTNQSAAIDPVFNSTSISNEANQNDYPYYWSSTTHENMTNGGNTSYVSFGRAMGNMEGNWMDVHGAGAQRSDPKAGDPDNYPDGHGPQGDAIRIFNYVRDADITQETNTGALIVNISPQEAVEDNMQWKVDDGDWQNSGDTVLYLSVCNHNVSFKSNENWIPPEDKTVTITDGETTTINVTFISNSSSETCKPGDLDFNGKINLKDVNILLQKFVNMNSD
jgi:hypothetical protein